MRVADLVSRSLGADATLWDQTIAGLSYAPAYTIMGGTSNVMRNILAERVLGLARSSRERPPIWSSIADSGAGSGFGFEQYDRHSDIPAAYSERDPTCPQLSE